MASASSTDYYYLQFTQYNSLQSYLKTCFLLIKYLLPSDSKIFFSITKLKIFQCYGFHILCPHRYLLAVFRQFRISLPHRRLFEFFLFFFCKTMLISVKLWKLFSGAGPWIFHIISSILCRIFQAINSKLLR